MRHWLLHFPVKHYCYHSSLELWAGAKKMLDCSRPEKAKLVIQLVCLCQRWSIGQKVLLLSLPWPMFFLKTILISIHYLHQNGFGTKKKKNNKNFVFSHKSFFSPSAQDWRELCITFPSSTPKWKSVWFGNFNFNPEISFWGTHLFREDSQPFNLHLDF